MTKVLFLDVDGVLNHRAVFVPGNPVPICPLAWERCKRVVAATGAKIVLSSTWRMASDPDRDRHIGKLRSIGLFELTHADWRTPYNLTMIYEPFAEYPKRGDEIASWLHDHPEVTRYAIVDDDSDILDGQQPFFVQTEFETGMLDSHRDRLIEILGARS